MTRMLTVLTLYTIPLYSQLISRNRPLAEKSR